MKLIYGEHSSGKSRKALKLIKDKDKVFYLSLDQDRSLSDLFSKDLFKKSKFHVIKNCFLIDIEFAIIGSGGKPIFDTIVIDSLNFIKLVEDVNHEFNLKRIIKGLEYLHYTYDIEVIATYNVLRNIDIMRSDVKDLFVDKEDWELIETPMRETKKKKMTITTKDGTIDLPKSSWSLF